MNLVDSIFPLNVHKIRNERIEKIMIDSPDINIKPEEWKSLNLSKTRDVVRQKTFNGNNIYFTFPIEHEDIFFLITKETRSIFQQIFMADDGQFIEVNEFINCDGKIIKGLKESELNEILRKIFDYKPGLVQISLINSCVNPIHERSLSNLIKTPGYKSQLSSDVLKQLYKNNSI